MTRFIICESDGNVSIDSDDMPESFDTLLEAEERARELSVSQPGEDIVIFVSLAVVRAEVAAPTITPVKG